MEYIVITGVSSGIGYDAARYLIERGYHVFGSVRKEADAARVQTQLGERFTPLLFDVTDAGGVQTAVSQVKSILGNQTLTALINNAGISTPGPLMHLTTEDLRQQLEINVIALHNITQSFLQVLGTDKNSPSPPGRIINISSVSGKIAYPFMGAYAASKHAVEAMSDSLRRELIPYGIDVILIQPGTVKTPIINKFAAQIEKFNLTDYAPILAQMGGSVAEREQSSIPVSKISRTIHQAIVSNRPKTRYPVPRKWVTGWLLPRWLPDRWLDKLIARKLRIKR